MKNIKLYILMILVGQLSWSCRDESTLPFNFDEDTKNNNGAFVRSLDIVSAEFDLNNLGAAFMEIGVEAYDVDGGSLLQDVTVFVSMIDNTPDNGDASKPLTQAMVIPAASFSPGAESGLPNTNIRMTAADAMSILGLASPDLDGGDVFRFDWTINLTNGKSFNRFNRSGSVSSWDFYSAPFFLDVGVVCLLTDGFAMGDYTLDQTVGSSDPFFGGAAKFACSGCNGANGGTVTLAEGSSSTKRVFGFDWITFPSTMGFDLVCGNVVISADADPGASCGGGIVWATNDASGKGSFDPTNDGVITINFLDDSTDDCGLGEPIVLTLTKI